MKNLRQKIRDIRNSLQLLADSRKSGGGGTWEFVSLSGLYSALNPLLDEKGLDIEIEDIGADNGEFIKVSVIDLDSGVSKSSTMKLKESDKQGIQHVQNREAQKSFFVRTAIISLFRLNILTSKETGVTNITGNRTKNSNSTIIAKLKLKAGATYIKNVEEKYKCSIYDLSSNQLEKLLKSVEKKIAERGVKNESK